MENMNRCTSLRIVVSLPLKEELKQNVFEVENEIEGGIE